MGRQFRDVLVVEMFHFLLCLREINAFDDVWSETVRVCL